MEDTTAMTTMSDEEPQSSLLVELAAILRDYQECIDRLGPETFRLQGESLVSWVRRRERIPLVLDVLERAAEVMASASGDEDLKALASDLARTPCVPPPEALCSRCLRRRSSEIKGRGDLARWDSIGRELVEVLGDLALLGAAATGVGEVVAQIGEAASHVARAAALVLPKSRYGADPGAERT